MYFKVDIIENSYIVEVNDKGLLFFVINNVLLIWESGEVFYVYIDMYVNWNYWWDKWNNYCKLNCVEIIVIIIYIFLCLFLKIKNVEVKRIWNIYYLVFIEYEEGYG